jgi:hypothetical protein
MTTIKRISDLSDYTTVLPYTKQMLDKRQKYRRTQLIIKME